MAVDEALAQRLRDRLCEIDGVSEKKMMGGHCFLHNGHMIAGADRPSGGDGRFMSRVGKANHAIGKELPGTEPMIQGGRRMTGLCFVSECNCDDAVMRDWLSLAIENAASLPPK